jgi:hypothetical protein
LSSIRREPSDRTIDKKLQMMERAHLASLLSRSGYQSRIVIEGYDG